MLVTAADEEAKALQHPQKKVLQMVGNERAHYIVPANTSSNAGFPDVILYRSGEAGFVYAATRGGGPKQSDWIG